MAHFEFIEHKKIFYESLLKIQKHVQIQQFVVHVKLTPQPVKLKLNKKLDPKQKISRPSILMPKGSEKLEMKILPHGK